MNGSESKDDLRRLVERLTNALRHAQGYALYLKTNGGAGHKTSYDDQMEIERLLK